MKSTLPGPPTRAQLAQLWSRAGRQLAISFWGVGGKGLAPDPTATYTVIEIKQGGFSRGYTVTGPGKREWSAKFPPEAPTEVVASRILWGVGYHQPPIYYVQRVEGREGDRSRIRSCRRAFARRIRRSTAASTTPASGRTTRIRSSARAAAAGCSSCRRCSATPISRTSKNANYALRQPLEGARTWYVARDLGQTFGRTGVLDAPRGDIDVFEKTPFITGVVNGRVTFDWRGRHDALLRRHHAGRCPVDLRPGCSA